jgi:hypothetical protein
MHQSVRPQCSDCHLVQGHHQELRYFTLDASWQSTNTQRLSNASLEEWQRYVVHVGHAWRCHNQLVDDEGELVQPITLETTITDLIEQRAKLSRERAAAVTMSPAYWHYRR